MAMDPYLKKRFLNRESSPDNTQVSKSQSAKADKFTEEELEEMGINENHDILRGMFTKIKNKKPAED